MAATRSLTYWLLLACLLGLHLSAASAQNPSLDAGTDAAPDQPCCQARAISVPIATYTVDIGLPLLLLLISCLVLRNKRAKAAAKAAALADGAPASAPSSAATAVAVKIVDPLPNQNAVGLTPWERLKARIAALRGRSGHGNTGAAANAAQVERQLATAAAAPVQALLESLETTYSGLTSQQAAERLAKFGRNAVDQSKPPSTLHLVYRAAFEPFNGLMLVVAILTVCPPNSSYPTFVLIMVLLSAAVALRFWEELRSRALHRTMATSVIATTNVLRDGVPTSVDLKDIALGDVVTLSAGDLIPGDVRVLESRNLCISMSGMTGEAMSVERLSTLSTTKETALNHENMCLMSTSVVSGSGKGVVVATGTATYIASLARALPCGHLMNAFDFAIRRIVYLFIAFIIVMVPLVIVCNGLTTGDWDGALVFGLAVAVGLTPQMLPMIVTANLSRSVRIMRAQKTAVRRMDAIQNLGAMDVLCTDKTGTLTVDEVHLFKALDIAGQESLEILRLAYANSSFQAGVPNLLDRGVLNVGRKRGLHKNVEVEWAFLDEIPFDFERRMLSVMLRPAGKALPMLVTKGALEELLAVCDSIMENGTVTRLDAARQAAITELGLRLNDEGMRVLGLATKSFERLPKDLSREDEAEMVFRGFLAFLDPPKDCAIPCIQELHARGIAVKVLTGDSLNTAKRICKDMGIDNAHCVTGAQLLAAEKEDLAELIERCTVFAKVTPQQKMAIVAGLQRAGHIVGFLGDGNNDALALRKADVGVSVDSGTDTAKMAADMVMLDKDLAIICKGVLTGRITYGNTIKYIKFASSSSFGNMFSILAGAIWLPFTPLQAIQVLVLNVLYNISQFAIPWDTMDPEFLEKPKRWSAKFLGLYMLIIGPVSSIFDMTTFVVMWHVYQCWNADPDKAQLFQTAWFLESLMTQTFIVHLLRTEKIPFVTSRAAWPLMVSSFGTMAAGIAICYIPGLNAAVGMAPVIPSYYLWLIGCTSLYCVAVQIYKAIYIKVFHSWL